MEVYLLGCILTATFYIAYNWDGKENIKDIFDISAFIMALLFIVFLWPVYWGMALAVLAQEHDL